MDHPSHYLSLPVSLPSPKPYNPDKIEPAYQTGRHDVAYTLWQYDATYDLPAGRLGFHPDKPGQVVTAEKQL
ncbi:hypothetical protein [Lunatimonas salinarum]|uniref:hypothetical protein n=1 Tax=Lunatimonas salinarum TaxID=1774590 RepID=UPI001ADF6F3B|nr:hypothetical protein [Lunatimonas salinarum]